MPSWQTDANVGYCTQLHELHALLAPDWPTAWWRQLGLRETKILICRWALASISWPRNWKRTAEECLGKGKGGWRLIEGAHGVSTPFWLIVWRLYEVLVMHDECSKDQELSSVFTETTYPEHWFSYTHS